jgi:four helix bundle protein
MNNFRSYDLAKSLYQQCKRQPVKGYVRDQLLRASLSVCLNLIEGSAKPTKKDRARFYAIALGSIRETQAIVELENLPLDKQADIVGAHVFKLLRAVS